MQATRNIKLIAIDDDPQSLRLLEAALRGLLGQRRSMSFLLPIRSKD